MLGVRLDRETDERLGRYAKESHRTRSDIARDAVREYLDRHTLDKALARDLRRIRDNTSAEDEAALMASTAEYMRMLDEEDGGYDWGPNGPPL